MTEPTESAAKPTAPTVESRVVDLAIRLGFLALFVYGSLVLIAPFIGVVLWAVILAVAIYPGYVWLRAHLWRQGWLASLLITLVALAVILGPASALAVSFADTIGNFVTNLENGTIRIPPPSESVASWPLIGDRLHDIWLLASTNLEDLLKKAGPTLLPAGGTALSKIAGVGFGVLLFAASIVIAAFLYGPGPRYAEDVRRFARRITFARGDEFVDLTGATIRNVTRGVIGVALIQTALAGILLWLFGVPIAGVLTFIILILCIVQLGPGIVLIPAIIWAWTAMDTGAAAGFTVLCLPVLLLDNILKPVLMARGLKTPMLVIFIGVIGGTLSYGLIGLFLGPVILSVFYELLIAWVRSPEPSHQPATPAEPPGN